MEQLIGLVSILCIAFAWILPWTKRENLDYVQRNRFVLWFFGNLGVYLACTFFWNLIGRMGHYLTEGSLFMLLLSIIAVGAFQWKYNGIAIGRIKDAGWQTWVYWLGLIPIVGFGMHLILLFSPSKHA